MKSCRTDGRKLPRVCEDGTLEGESELRKTLADFAVEAFRSADEKFAGSPLVLTVLESQKENFADAILLFLRTFCRTFGGCTVVAVEQWMGGPVAGMEDTALTGRIDCVLSDDNGSVSIIDYKNTAAGAPSAAASIADEQDRLGDFQIPMYVTLWNMAHAGDGTAAVENALFYTISDRKSRYVVQNEHRSNSGAVTAAEYTRTLGCFAAYVQDFVHCVRSGTLAADSDHVDVYRDCRTCRFKSVCRTSYISSGIRIPSPQGVEK
jgi:hypothetical protein